MKGVVDTTQGRLRGVWRGDLWSFSGVPYGRAPVGPLRWRPPLPPEPWDTIRDASTFGAIAPQASAVPGITSPSDPDASEPQSEDCLFLNVWTPDLDPEARRPVLVFIHGGGFTSGSGSVFLYRGGNLVRNGDAVVVTINYRLGALGFLGHRELADPDGLVGNWGIADQVAALAWVRENISAFGGDPGNVTVFGESAGGFSVAALLGCPAARGLFHRAIVQSGGAHVHTVEEAERAGERLAVDAGDRDVRPRVAREGSGDRARRRDGGARQATAGPGPAPAALPAHGRRGLPADRPVGRRRGRRGCRASTS